MLAALEEIRRAEQQARTRIAEAEAAVEAARDAVLQQTREEVRSAARQAEDMAATQRTQADAEARRQAETLVAAGREEAEQIIVRSRSGYDAAVQRAMQLITGEV